MVHYTPAPNTNSFPHFTVYDKMRVYPSSPHFTIYLIPQVDHKGGRVDCWISGREARQKGAEGRIWHARNKNNFCKLISHKSNMHQRNAPEGGGVPSITYLA